MNLAEIRIFQDKFRFETEDQALVDLKVFQTLLNTSYWEKHARNLR